MEQRSDYDNQANSSQTIYNFSTLIDNDLMYDNTTIENNPYENDVHENDMHVNDNMHEDQSSMSAQSMLNLGLSRKGFKMGHLNIQGIQNKIDQIDLLLNSSQNNIHILGLSETKLNSNHMNSIFEVKNYQMFRKDRVISEDRPEHGGGLIVYVKDGINCKRRYDLECERIECVWLEIFPTNCKSFLIGNIYRHPNETVNWNEGFDNYLDKVLECEKEMYLMGDFNRDLMQTNIKQSWVEYMESFGLHQIVNMPTRVTDQSATLIDHIYSNTHANILTIAVPHLGLSDHFPVFVSRKTNGSCDVKNTHYTISYRSFKNFDENKFIDDLKSTPWDIIKVFDDVNDIVETWSNLFCEIVDKHLPLRQHRVKRKQQPKWLTADIIDAFKTRDRFKSLNNQEQYKIWRNKVSKMIKASKTRQYSEIINENVNNPSSVWKLFKELGASKRNIGSSIFSIKINDKTIDNPSEISTEFNKFFVSVASKIKEPVVPSNFDRLRTFCNEKLTENTSFSIPTLGHEKVEKYLKNIDITKATGVDTIGPRLLKLAAPYISESLTFICNQSIVKSVFPKKWKEGKVTPLHKNGAKDDTTNYRPISVLPVVSKLLEKHVHDSLMAYLSSNSLLHSTQSGFRPNHSCETSLLQMINKWLDAINSSQMIGMVMIDFRKAFDLVDHTLLLKKLKYYKISEETISWFSSYLLGRKQKVFVNNVLSESENIICGVPQGSILGPLLFLIFINDLPLEINNVLTDLYADDTTLYYIDKSQACIEQQLQTALHKLSEWCKENGMLINTTKTKVMLITTPQRRVNLNNYNFHLTYTNEALSVVTCEKILGVFIDNNLTWTNHTDAVAKKIVSNLWLLSRIKTYLTTHQRVQFYKSYVQPHIDYCNTIWGGTSQRNLDRIYRLQKRACKIILDYKYENIADSMEELKILNIYERIYLKKAKFMFKISKSLTPKYINEMFQLRPLNNTLQSLRSSATINYVLPRPHKELFKQSLIYSGPLIWNNLPDDLRQLGTIDTFHKNCIKWMKRIQIST